jgi:hypothetical protein
MSIATATENNFYGATKCYEMGFEESVKRSINAVQPTHLKTAHVVDSEGEAAEAKTDTEWCPKGTWRPGAVIFQCRRNGLPLENREEKVGVGGRPQSQHAGRTQRNIRWQAELSLTMVRIRKVEAEECIASLVTALRLGGDVVTRATVWDVLICVHP